MKKRELFLAILMAMAGLMLVLHRPAGSGLSVARAYETRVLQVWPDRYTGVTSALLAGSTTYTSTQTLPFGVYRHPSGDTVHARTYLHFPTNVFPPGTDVRRATLHMYIDSASNSGEMSAGVYRVLGAWRKAGWESDPATWPALLPSPLSVARIQVAVVTDTLPAAPAPTATPASVLTPTATVTVTPPLTPALTPTSTISLGRIEGTWVSWDVTVLMRAWIGGEIANEGLAIAAAPDPAAPPEEAGNLLAARYPFSETTATRPYIVAEFDVLPVTPTPPPSPLAARPLLPAAGSRHWPAGWVMIGIGLLLLILAWSTRSSRERKDHG
ncbi:MAG: DNRLRE domain-containing protein [Anaerolineae bacterium]|nr:DNRLRE domain-containing protein [Anaerolineae bacterium]